MILYTRVDRKLRCVEAVDRATGLTHSIPYDRLILATGADAIVPPIDHVRAPNVFLMRSMEDTRAIHDFLAARRPARAVVVGAGFIGLEMAEALRRRGLDVAVVEKAPHPLPMLDPELARPVAAELARNEVALRTAVGLKSLHAGADGLVTAVELEDGTRLPAELILLSIGVRPNVSLAAAAGLALGRTCAIAVNAFQQTSDPDVYAAGDNSEVVHGATGATARVPLAGPANRQGRLAGEHAATGNAVPAAAVLGTAIVKVFDLTVALTGRGEDAARRAGAAVDSAIVLPASHATYYPGASPMRFEVVYETSTGRVVGAQAVGGEGVDKRIDVIATAMHFRATIDDLADLDLAYAPQFSSAKDPVHVAAFVAQNQRTGLVRAIPAPHAAAPGHQLLDVRTPREVAATGSLPGAIHIPLDDLRDRLAELDPTRPTVVMCQAGLRGYVASRILRQHGFADVSNIKGGWTALTG